MSDSNKKNSEKYWDFIMFKVPMTDKEIKEGVSWPMAIIMLSGIVVLFGWVIMKLL